MFEPSRVALISLVLAIGLTGCIRQRDTDLGGDRYLVSATGNGYSGIAATEESFHQHAREVATAHGFDSYKVVDLRSGAAKHGEQQQWAGCAEPGRSGQRHGLRGRRWRHPPHQRPCG